MKPPDYRHRRTWQNEARARGETPECGREACNRPADPAWVGSGTGVELLYCAGCAALINRMNPEIVPPLCRPEVSVQRPDVDPVAIVLATVHRVAPLPVNVHVSDHLRPGTYVCHGGTGPILLSRVDYDRLRETIEGARRV